ncbi:MAG: VOC family protein [Desulfobacterales bacterium]|nr:VOC family protein [Desulfobacterales bacterium]
MKNCLITTNTILYCKEWEKTVEFYKDRLKLPVLFATEWFVEFGLNEMSRLSIADEKRSSVRSCGSKGITLAMEVNDIEAAREHAKEFGMKPTQLRKHPWDAWVFNIFDPEGHRIEIWQAFKNTKVQL